MQTYSWTGAGFEPADDPSGEIWVADSWRQTDGWVRRLDLHRDRFVGAVEKQGLDAGEFFDEAAKVIPAEGEWFPRVRLVDERLFLDVREGPGRKTEAVVEVLPEGDPRKAPRVKGPDLVATADLIASSQADEILFRDGVGTILEAGFASVVWWDGGVLCVPSANLPVLPSVTRALVVERAKQEGIEVREVKADFLDLNGQEAWLLNAYQGIRLVTEWKGADIAAGPGERFPQWRQVFEER